METKALFKVNQTVYDSALFSDLKGKVIDDKYDVDYPIRVDFVIFIKLYTIDGRLDKNANQTLSDQPYKVEYVPPQPQIELPEVGQWCWFWDDSKTFFTYAKFVRYNKESDFPFLISTGFFYKNCSTTNPIENEKPN